MKERTLILKIKFQCRPEHIIDLLIQDKRVTDVKEMKAKQVIEVKNKKLF